MQKSQVEQQMNNEFCGLEIYILSSFYLTINIFAIINILHS